MLFLKGDFEIEPLHKRLYVLYSASMKFSRCSGVGHSDPSLVSGG